MTSLRKRILHVDDDASILDLFKIALMALPLDIEVSGFTEPALAYDFCVNAPQPPDLMIFDVHMPGFSGLQLLTKLRSLGSFAQIPAFFMTSQPHDDLKEQAMRAGAVAFLHKPFGLDDWGPVLKAVRHALLGSADETSS